MYIIIKVGSALLVNMNGTLKYETLNNIISGIKYLQSIGKKPILVSSGAIAAGGQYIAFKKLSKGVKSAIGQPILMNEYNKIAQKNGLVIAQYLISKEDLSDYDRYLYLKQSFQEATKLNIIPIINDNDILHGIKQSFTDNDQLACKVGIMMNAKKIILLTSVDGIYNNFGTKKQQKIEIIKKSEELNNIQTTAKTQLGTGGWKNKRAFGEI